ncbi:MAG: hypothetical protein NTU53_07015 [Planctomycetota bacterium]|nr:hypothetical protein [Planctomycetota bacterium]
MISRRALLAAAGVACLVPDVFGVLGEALGVQKPIWVDWPNGLGPTFSKATIPAIGSSGADCGEHGLHTH